MRQSTRASGRFLRRTPPATATVPISYGSENLDIVVEDTGASPRNDSGRGLGLIGIRERVAVVGATSKPAPARTAGSSSTPTFRTPCTH